MVTHPTLTYTLPQKGQYYTRFVQSLPNWHHSVQKCDPQIVLINYLAYLTDRSIKWNALGRSFSSTVNDCSLRTVRSQILTLSVTVFSSLVVLFWVGIMKAPYLCTFDWLHLYSRFLAMNPFFKLGLMKLYPHHWFCKSLSYSCGPSMWFSLVVQSPFDSLPQIDYLPCFGYWNRNDSDWRLVVSSSIMGNFLGDLGSRRPRMG